MSLPAQSCIHIGQKACEPSLWGWGSLAALTAVEAELPVVSDRDAARQARLLLDVCLAAGAVEWVFALALSLDHGPALAGKRLPASSHGHPI